MVHPVPEEQEGTRCKGTEQVQGEAVGRYSVRVVEEVDMVGSVLDVGQEERILLQVEVGEAGMLVQGLAEVGALRSMHLHCHPEKLEAAKARQRDPVVRC